MASSKDIPSRPISQHRSSMSTTPSSSLPIRHTHNRQHSNSLTVGSLNSAHRVSRRKSMSSTAAANVAAVAAAVQDGLGDENIAKSSSKRNLNSKAILGSKNLLSSSVPASSQQTSFGGNIRKAEANDEENNDLEVPRRPSASGSAAKGRRSSDGGFLSKTEAKKLQPGELKCETCGKAYKHGSCLSKHLWEHTPEWSYTSKLLISKHQQVQLLEAASVLVAMNQDAATDGVRPDSDNSSASPAASGSSESQDGVSSTETTPPPQSEDMSVEEKAENWGRYRMGSISSAYSQSYQSVRSSSVVASSVPTGFSDFSHYRQTSGDHRSITPGTLPWKAGDEEEASLAAAVELLSCSFGTPRSGPFTIPEEVPPVPPLPSRYLDGTPKQVGVTSYTRHQSHDVRMTGSNYEDEEYDSRFQQNGKGEDEDDGVFGQMEE